MPDTTPIRLRCGDSHKSAVYYLTLAEGQSFDPLDTFGKSDFDQKDQLRDDGRTALGEVGGKGRDELEIPSDYRFVGVTVSPGIIIEIDGEPVSADELRGTEQSVHNWGQKPEMAIRDLLELIRSENDPDAHPVLEGNQNPLPEEGSDGPDHYDELTTHGPDGPDPDLAEQYDHYIEVNGTQWGERIRYHLITTGEIVPARTGDTVDNRGAFGHAEGGVKGWLDGYHYNGSLLNVFVGPMSVGEWRRRNDDSSLGVMDLPYAVFVDGKAIDHDRFDPRSADAGTPIDIDLGYQEGSLPDAVQPSASDADHTINSWREFADLDDSDVSPGDLIWLESDIGAPAVNGTLKRFTTDCLTFACDTDAVLHSDKAPDSRWANILLDLKGKHCSLLDFKARGSNSSPRDYSQGSAMGIVHSGRYLVAMNCHISQFGQFNMSDRGLGATFMGVDSFDSQVKGSGYGLASDGPANVGAWDPDEYNTVQPWHERTSIKFVRIDGCRHNIERASNGSTEARWFAIGGTTRWGGAQDDTHRFARGEDVESDFAIMQGWNEVTISRWWRGRPRLVRMGRGWIEGWNDRDWSDQLDPETARRHPSGEDKEPTAQRCARDAYYRDRTQSWEKSDGPLLPHPSKNATERRQSGGNETVAPDSMVWQFDTPTLQDGGTRPDWIEDAVYSAVKWLRDNRR